MKHKLHSLILLLCALIVGSGTSWGQSDNSAVYTSNVTLSTSGGTSAYTAKVRLSSNGTQYDAIKAGTSSVKGAIKISVPSGTKYLHIHVAGWNNENVTLSVTPNNNISPNSISLTKDTGISGNSPFTLGTPGNATSNYYKVITFTNALTSATDLTFTANSSTTGKRFVIWGVNSEAASSTPTYALTITEPTGGTITVLDSEANTVNSGDKFEEGEELTISAEASTGYTFSTWTKTAGTFKETATTADNTFTMPGSAATLGATFTKNSYDLTLTNENGSCTVTVDGNDWDGSSKIPYNAEVEITATANDGYLFVNWTSTDIGEFDNVTNPLTFNMPAKNVEITAAFESQALYKTISVDDNVTGGTISADMAAAKQGTTVTLTATPDDGYSFTAWDVKDAENNAIPVTDNKFTMPNANVTVSATFTAIAVTGVSLNKNATTIGVGDTETLTATITPANALNKNVTWTSSDETVATVNNAGVVTGVAAGSATITATSTVDGTKSASCTVTVENAITINMNYTWLGSSNGSNLNSNQLPVIKSQNDITITITDGTNNRPRGDSDYIRVYTGSTIKFDAPTGYSIKSILFTTGGNNSWNQPSVNSIGVWDESKLWSDNNTIVPSVTFTLSGSCFIASAKVTLSPIPVTSVTLNKTETSIVVGGTETLTATVNPNTAIQTVTWSSSDENKATVTAAGVVTAVAAGSATITATSTVDGTKSASCTVTVAAEAVHPTSVSLNKNATTITVGDTETLTATIAPNNATNQNVTWTSSDDDVATVDAGVVTAVAKGTATITVTTVDGGKTATCDVTVENVKHSLTFNVLGVETDGGQVEEEANISFPSNPASQAGYTFVGWTTSTISGTQAAAPAVLVNSAQMGTEDVTYYAVFAKKKWGDTYTKLTSNSFDSEATYVIGALDGDSEVAYFYLNDDDNWGKMTSSPEINSPLKIKLSGTASALKAQMVNGNSYITTGSTANNAYKWKLSETESTIVLGNAGNISVTVSSTVYTLRFNTSVSNNVYQYGLRWYKNNTGNEAYFYQVGKAWINSDYCTTIPTPETVTITAALNATWVAPAKMQFGNDVTVYTVAYDLEDDGIIRKYEVKDKIVPANGVVMLTSESATSADVTTEITNDQDNYATLVAEGKNQLQVSDGTKQGSSTTYVLAKKNNLLGFYALKSGDYVPAGKAYLEISNQQNAPQFLWFDGETTAIDSLNTERESLNNGAIYDLSGRRITNGQSLPKGIYVQNGKKFIVK